VIAEDSGLLRQLLVEALTGHGLEVVAQAGDPVALHQMIDATRPEAVVLDIRMPPTHTDEGMRAAGEIRSRHPSIGLLMLSQHAETAYAVRLLEIAAHSVGYLIKDRVHDVGQLVDALRRVGAGDTVIDPEIVARLIRRPRAPDPLRELMPSELAVLTLMAEGFSNLGIAHRLSYSPKTVEKRISAIAQKLGLPPPGTERPEINVRVLAVLRYLRLDSATDRA
jgi:DNA-binding NarL/FixJ family response regulator